MRKSINFRNFSGEDCPWDRSRIAFITADLLSGDVSVTPFIVSDDFQPGGTAQLKYFPLCDENCNDCSPDAEYSEANTEFTIQRSIAGKIIRHMIVIICL